MANPFDQFDATSSAPASGANPFDQFDAKAKTAQAPSDNDYSKSPLSALGRTFESSADWGVGDLLRAAATGKKPSETAAQSSAAAASLPWYVRYPTEAAGYGLGLVNLLDPVTDAAEAGAGMLGAGATLSKIAGTAAEGATVGGVSHVAGSDDPTLMGTAGAALGGAGVGAAAGGLTRGVNAGLTKAFGRAPSIDPDAALATTQAANDAAWKAGRNIPVNGAATNTAISSAMKGLDPSVQTGLSDGFLGKIAQIQGAISDQGKIGQSLDANQVNSWKRQINDAAGPGIEGGVAKSISDNLDGVLQAHGAGQWQEGANQAYQNYMMAQNLGEWSRKAAAGAPLGQAPLTEAEKFYQGKPQYQTLVDLYQKSQSQNDPSWALGHMAAGAIGDIGGMLLGFPGHLAGEALGYLGIKPAIKGAFKGAKQNALQKNIQQAYPQMTGQQITGATTGPQIGDAIKNLMLGSAY